MQSVRFINSEFECLHFIAFSLCLSSKHWESLLVELFVWKYERSVESKTIFSIWLRKRNLRTYGKHDSHISNPSTSYPLVQLAHIEHLTQYYKRTHLQHLAH